MKKSDIILATTVILTAAAVLFILEFAVGTSSDTVVVEVNGEVYAEFPLNEDREYLIHSDGGGTNLLEINDGKARIIEASCPDKVCVKTGYASEIKSIVCRPNKVLVYIESLK